MKPEYWLAFQVSLEGDSLALRQVSGDKAGETTKEIENYIRRNLDNADVLFAKEEPVKLTRVERARYDELAKRLSGTALKVGLR